VSNFLEESKDRFLEGGGALDAIDRRQPKNLSSIFQCLTPSSSESEDNNEEEDKEEIDQEEIKESELEKPKMSKK
jgi:hypothetical protein